METRQLSVIIPAYNEQNYIEGTVREVAAALRERQIEFEVLVVNDGSRDATADIVRSLNLDFPQVRLWEQPENRGKGEAVKEGIRLARYPLCLFMDADNATRISEWGAFEARFQEGYPCVIASRHLRESVIVKPQPWTRRFLGTGYRILCRFLFGIRVSDFNCGFKAYETELARKIFPQVTMRDWTFDVEVFIRLKRLGVRFAEVPVRWTDRKPQDSSIKPWQTAWRSLISLCRLKKAYH